MNTQQVRDFPYHPAYGLPDEVRADAVYYAEKHSVKDAALVYRVSACCIYRWRKDMQTTGDKR